VTERSNVEEAIQGKVRVYRQYPLLNDRPADCVLDDFPDDKLFPCETHGIMRVTESIVKAYLPKVFNEGECEKLNKNLEELKMR
jgi:hypothetical protein